MKGLVATESPASLEEEKDEGVTDGGSSLAATGKDCLGGEQLDEWDEEHLTEWLERERGREEGREGERRERERERESTEKCKLNVCLHVHACVCMSVQELVATTHCGDILQPLC